MKRTPLRRTAITRRPKRNVMTSASHDIVLRRDGQCVAQALEPDAGLCRDSFGKSHVSWDWGRLTVDHIKDAAMIGQSEDRDDTAKAVALCFHHHLNGWATANRPLLRLYLKWRCRYGMPTLPAGIAARKEWSDGAQP